MNLEVLIQLLNRDSLIDNHHLIYLNIQKKHNQNKIPKPEGRGFSN